jgi:hypothetical protein
MALINIRKFALTAGILSSSLLPGLKANAQSSNSTTPESSGSLEECMGDNHNIKSAIEVLEKAGIDTSVLVCPTETATNTASITSSEESLARIGPTVEEFDDNLYKVSLDLGAALYAIEGKGGERFWNSIVDREVSDLHHEISPNDTELYHAEMDIIGTWGENYFVEYAQGNKVPEYITAESLTGRALATAQLANAIPIYFQSLADGKITNGDISAETAKALLQNETVKERFASLNETANAIQNILNQDSVYQQSLNSRAPIQNNPAKQESPSR